MERPVLYVNACVRKESRTMNLAEKMLQKLGRPYREVVEIARAYIRSRGGFEAFAEWGLI